MGGKPQLRLSGNVIKLPIPSVPYKIKDESRTYTSFCHGPERKPNRIDMFKHRVDFDNPNDSNDNYYDGQREHSCQSKFLLFFYL